jgi:hypothetical protein
MNRKHFAKATKKAIDTRTETPKESPQPAPESIPGKTLYIKIHCKERRSIIT